MPSDSRDQQMTVLAWSPLRGGLLTGKYLPGSPAGSADASARLNIEMLKGVVTANESDERIIREVMALAREMEATPAQVALAWLRHRPVPVIPIIGARRLTQLAAT
ncbi:MAG TPA: aldo/keto reductase [Chthoniobacterales bacterium]